MSYHLSVMLDEVIESLRIQSDGIYLDATVGGGGHASKILEKIDRGLLIAMDKDDEALHYAKRKLKAIGGNFVLARGDFANAPELLDELEIDFIDGALLDLGVSSHQLDEAMRGFSYHQDAPLDMRMDRSQKQNAQTIVNEYSEDELTDILYRYGEEKWARRIARFIVEYRPIETTFELVDVIKRAVPAGARDRKHPARRTFQALRIAVNNELDDLSQNIEDIVERLTPGGRIAILTFHSLEDRIVKNTFRDLEKGCRCPEGIPVCVCGGESMGKVITRKPIIASNRELEFNTRSRSAKLRVFERRSR
ncbi:MAG: 16S rRNA (cytosine(1402)-N(4))-methyltransferase RsmH [Tissierellia bacterium]|nr:16S rRNA (cytosine(1402)-N(4))-methyltransferase RsmH [Bacillota bacterium]NLL23328.1 16S rRNA (cytosine(1402)-N(4))-methyltransferase RsmH [Tissierellia bacterium]